MAASATDWLHTDRAPTDVFELLGRQRLDPDTEGLLADARTAYRALLAYQNHGDRAICRRAMQLLTELGRIADIHTNPRQLDRYLEQVIERLRREYLAEAGGVAGMSDFARLRTWLANTANVHADSVEAAMLAILEPTDLQATLESSQFDVPVVAPSSERIATLPPEVPPVATGTEVPMPAPAAGEPRKNAPNRNGRRLGIVLVLLVPLAACAAAFPWTRGWWASKRLAEPVGAAPAAEPVAPAPPPPQPPAQKEMVALPPLADFAPADFLPARRAFLVAVRPGRLCVSPVWHDARTLFFPPISAFQESFHNRRGIAFEQLSEVVVASDGGEMVATLSFDEPASRRTWLSRHRFSPVGRRREVEILQAPDQACVAIPGPTLLVLGARRGVVEAAIDRAAQGGGIGPPPSSLLHLEVDDWLQFARFLDAHAAGREDFAPLGEQALAWARSVVKLSLRLEEADGSVHVSAESPHREAAVRLAPEFDSWRIALQQVLAQKLRAYGVRESTPVADRLLALTTGRVRVSDRRVEYTAKPVAAPPAVVEAPAPAAPAAPGQAVKRPAVARPAAAEQAALALFQGKVLVIFAEGESLPTRPVLDALKEAIDEQGLATAAARTGALRFRGSVLTVVMDSPPAIAAIVERLGPPDRTEAGILRHDAGGRAATVTWQCFGRLDCAVAGDRALAVRIHSGR